jgi:hypothetical protein
MTDVSVDFRIPFLIIIQHVMEGIRKKTAWAALWHYCRSYLEADLLRKSTKKVSGE